MGGFPRFILDDSPSPGGASSLPSGGSDAGALDSYFATVVGVCERVGPAVGNVEVVRRAGPRGREVHGNGSGFVRHHDLDVESGVRVLGVEPGSPARVAGLDEGDIIVAFDGSPVAGVDELHRLLSAERIGEPARLTVLRRTEKKELLVTTGEIPAR
jgi:membrane-associated protease RseP (regulator of RpoE activity)